MALTRKMDDKVIAGVCSGLAGHLGLDSVVMRLLFVFGFLMFGFGPIIYLILWILMPKDV